MSIGRRGHPLKKEEEKGPNHAYINYKLLQLININKGHFGSI